MSKFEKKFGKYAIKNLSLMLIMCYVAGYILQLINSNFLYFLTLDPYRILHGQIWRIFTWILVPPSQLSIFTLIMLYFYYTVGTLLERTWGTYRYNVYLFSGMLFTVLASFLTMAFCYLFFGELFADPELAGTLFLSCSMYFSTYYINMSIYLLFAATFPNAQVLLMFVVPVRVKWMGIIYSLILVYEMIVGTSTTLKPITDVFYRFAIGASLLNFLVFLLRSRIHMTPKQIKRRQEFKSEVRRNPRPTTHKCAICGQTEENDPTLEFRYCSKCEGNYEYCQHHLFTHEHVRRQ